MNLCNKKVVEKWTQIEFILGHILQVPHIGGREFDEFMSFDQIKLPSKILKTTGPKYRKT